MAYTHDSKRRGAVLSPDNRYSQTQRERCDDGWVQQEVPATLRTELLVDKAKKIISYNRSPDVPFDRSINPYKGCEHGCVYCFARPTHAWLDLSPGLDFESKIFHKPDAVSLLKKELAARNYQCQPIALGINTDAYQPVEHQLGLTRSIIECLLQQRHPFSIITKSALIERDIDLLAEAAQQQLLHVGISVTTLQLSLNRNMEPRAAPPARRLQTIQRLREAGIPVSVLIAPIIPVLNDHELEEIMRQVHAAGAQYVGYVLLRLPHELDDMFIQWLQHHYPLKAEHVMNRVRDMRHGKHYQSGFKTRMTGEGIFAELLVKRFRREYQKLGFAGETALDCSRFIQPTSTAQMPLF